MQLQSNPTPQYRKVGIPDIDDNPLCAHLPLGPESDKEAFKALAMRPDFSLSERQLSGAIRRLRIKRLRRFFVPFLKEQRRALTGICGNIIDGYSARNPMTPLGQRILNGYHVDLPFPPVISLITGCSGMGKSTLVNQMLSYIGPQVLQHTSFDGKPFTETQINYLRRNTPERCTVRAFCQIFGDYTDSVLGMKLYSGIFSRINGTGTRDYLREIRRIVSAHNVGLLVLDELQNLSLLGVGAKTILAFLVNLRDELGLPIVAIGTYKALNLIEGDASAARRFVEGGFYDLRRPTSADDREWQELCDVAWKYQWVREPKGYTAAIGHALYQVSQGIPAIMLSVFAAAQVHAIESGSEFVDEGLLQKVFEEQMGPLHPAIRALQSGNPFLLSKFDSLYKEHWPGIESADSLPTSENLFSESRQFEAPVSLGVSASKRRNAATSAKKEISSAQLSEAQINDMVMAKSAQDLIDIMVRR